MNYTLHTLVYLLQSSLKRASTFLLHFRGLLLNHLLVRRKTRWPSTIWTRDRKTLQCFKRTELTTSSPWWLSDGHMLTLSVLWLAAGHFRTGPHDGVRGHESAATWQVPAVRPVRRHCVVVFLLAAQKVWRFVCFRVRLVERGSPHSLPLMESGKVSVIQSYTETDLQQVVICLQCWFNWKSK